MSRRSILLATAIWAAMATTASAAPSYYYYCPNCPPNPSKLLPGIGPGAHVTKPPIAPQGLPGVGPGLNVTKPSIAMQGLHPGGWHGRR